MKNLMDLCIGTVVFSLLGYTLMMGEDALFGLIGIPNLDMFTNFKEFIKSPGDGSFTGASTFVFNLVFCATTATIVSGAMAGRTKFSSYCIYSGIISLIVYPIEAHWIWGGGWLSELGFHDYAGSCAIHMVGGIAALIKYFSEKVAFLFQNFALSENKTVKQNLEMVPKKSRSGVSIPDALKAVGIEDKLNEYIYTLSGGEQQRVALARIMIKKCDIILADEPTGSLDKENANAVIDILKKLNTEKGKTVIMVTHDEELKKVGDRIINM